MALVCNMSLNYGSMTAGQNPSPQATLTVYNPNASAVVVTGASVFTTTLVGQQTNATNQSVVPLGPGMTTVVPTLSSITFGPFPIAASSSANVNSFQAVNQVGNLFAINPQPSQRPQEVLLVGATVYGSDGSVNTAGKAPLLVSYTSTPPVGYQGGPLFLSAPNNLALAFTVGLL